MRTDTPNLFSRIFNQIVSLATLKDAGKAREIPVFGFIEDIFVMGVMDEIERRALPSEKNTTEETPQVNKISNYFSPSKSPSTKRTEGIYLVDSKTRRVNSMPRAAHTVAVGRPCQSKFSQLNFRSPKRSSCYTSISSMHTLVKRSIGHAFTLILA